MIYIYSSHLGQIHMNKNTQQRGYKKKRLKITVHLKFMDIFVFLI